MIRRSGVTLIEVLVAIFVMAIGLLSLLALFPLGALNMAQAIKDERASQAAANADAVARFLPQNAGTAVGIRSDANVVAAYNSPPPNTPNTLVPSAGGLRAGARAAEQAHRLGS